MAATYVVAGLAGDFVSDFEDLVLGYIFTKWSISAPAKGSTPQDTTATLRFKAGMPDGLKPYEINALQTDTKVADKNDPHSWHFFTSVEIRVTAERIARDNIDPELGNIEREIQRIVNQYPANDIAGISDLIFMGMSRDYFGISGTGTSIRQATRTTALSSRWSSTTSILVSYYKTNTL
jgi:hypothetical protein